MRRDDKDRGALLAIGGGGGVRHHCTLTTGSSSTVAAHSVSKPSLVPLSRPKSSMTIVFVRSGALRDCDGDGEREASRERGLYENKFCVRATWPGPEHSAAAFAGV